MSPRILWPVRAIKSEHLLYENVEVELRLGLYNHRWILSKEVITVVLQGGESPELDLL